MELYISRFGVKIFLNFGAEQENYGIPIFPTPDSKVLKKALVY
jgi:hypothetical protein